jgi:2-oxoisovalerate dehydrogenase E1 component
VTEPNPDERLRPTLSQWRPAELQGDPQANIRPDSGLTGARALELFDAQLTSRHLDLTARRLRSADAGYYTISSAGHEGNAAVAAALRPTDPALLHYRSGAFYCARAGQLAEAKVDPIRDVLRGVVAAATDPISGGRHKVFGSSDLHIIPTTSTIASHLPRAVGVAFAIERNRVSKIDKPLIKVDWPRDAIAVCSFGDASVNHASATAAFNTVGWSDFTGLRLPLLFVCEDNGLGISVRSPNGWVGAVLKSRPGLRYYYADGCDLAETYAVARSAVAWVRRHRRPAVLHLRTVRLMGHAGADAEQAYRTTAEIEHDLALDPLLNTAKVLVDSGVATPMQLLSRYDEIGWRVTQVAEQVRHEPKLASAAEVVAPLAPRRPVRVVNTVAKAGARGAGALAAARERACGDLNEAGRDVLQSSHRQFARDDLLLIAHLERQTQVGVAFAPREQQVGTTRQPSREPPVHVDTVRARREQRRLRRPTLDLSFAARQLDRLDRAVPPAAHDLIAFEPSWIDRSFDRVDQVAS